MEGFDSKRCSDGLSAQTGPLETICGGSFLICISGTGHEPTFGWLAYSITADGVGTKVSRRGGRREWAGSRLDADRFRQERTIP